MGTAAESAFDFRIADEGADHGPAVLALYGDVDQFVAGELRDRLSAAIDEGGPAMVLDLTGVAFVDSMGLGILLGALKRIGLKGGELRLVIPKNDVRRVFELTQLDRVFTLDATRADALAAIGSPKDGPAPATRERRD
jgi:anti-sigma B factor antagonist